MKFRSFVVVINIISIIVGGILMLHIVKSQEEEFKKDIRGEIQNIYNLIEDVKSKQEKLRRTFTSYNHTNVDKYDILLIDNLSEIIVFCNNKLTKRTAKEYAKLIIDMSNTYNVPLEILFSVIWQESHFTADAVSKSGCIGLMQINPKVWKFDKDLLLIPSFNVQVGAGILRTYYNQTGSWKKALIKYYGVSDFAVKYYAPQVLTKVYKVKKIIKKESSHEYKQ